MKSFIRIQRAVWSLTALLLLVVSNVFAADPPNIVFILSDDQAWSDYGFMGHADIKTPHLDTLASSSLFFDRGYVAAPICRPSLASLVTGLFPHQHGVTGNDVAWGPDRSGYFSTKRHELDAPLRAAFHKNASFIRLLTSNGYLAHQSGKWWEGSWKDGGFTHGMTHGDPKRGGRHGDDGLTIGRTSMKPVTGFIDHAVEQKKPFLLWYAPFLPHTPHNPPKRLLEKYTKANRAPDVAKYYAMIEWFDETCGELLAYLNEKDLTKNTIVIYICDNGWAARSTRPNDPHQKTFGHFALRSKASPYENGTRTPIMISWPGHVKPKKSKHLAHAIDIFPTIAAAVGLKTPEQLTGINLLDEEAVKKRKAVFGVNHSTHNMSPHNPDEALQYIWCVEDNWKLLVRYPGKDLTKWRKLHDWDKKPVRLYDVIKDPHETKELSDAHPEVVARLKKKIEAWHASTKKPGS
jgi:arylsulfatase A-like enzyme